MKNNLHKIIDLFRIRMELSSIYPEIVRLYYVHNKSANFSEFKSYLEKEVQLITSELMRETLVNINKHILVDIDLEALYELLKDINLDELYDYFSNIGVTGIYGLPNEMLTLIIDLLGDTEGEVLDLCSGEGKFLHEYGKKYDARLNGIEINYDSYLNSKILHDLSENNYQIFNEDALRKNTLFKEKMYFDKIFSNFPFNLKRMGAHSSLDTSHFEQYKFENLPTTSLNWSFMATMVNLLKDDGKAIALVNLNSLFALREDSIRQQFLDYGLIEMIIELPEKLLGYTNIKTALVIFSKGNNKVTLIDAQNAFTKKQRRNILNVEKVKKLIKEDNKNKLEMTNEEIIENDTLLIPSKYILLESIVIKNPIKLENYIVDAFRGAQIRSKELDEITLKDKNEKENYRLVTLADLENELITNSGQRIKTEENKYDRYLLKNNDILITARGTRTNISLAQFDEKYNVIATGNILVVRLDEEKINPVYVHLFLKSKLGMKVLDSVKVGSVIKSINPSSLKDIEIPKVSASKQNDISNKYLAKIDSIRLLNKRLSKLEKERDMIFATEIEVL